MRKKIIAGNWKMNKTAKEAVELVDEVMKIISTANVGETQVVFCPPFTALETVSQSLNGRPGFFSAAQNCYWEKSGAYTGEISAPMIKASGASFVIIGHSERRQYFGETNSQLAKKTDAVLSENMIPIYCCGEPLEVREKETHFNLVEEQIKEGLFHLSPPIFGKVVIAYEPVWAIGTGKVASDEQAQEMHAFIRNLIREKYGEEVASNTTIQYGGSMKPSNAKGLLRQPDVDGGLIGGASLVAADFAAIIKAV
jgi:triosephosphate isomerase